MCVLAGLRRAENSTEDLGTEEFGVAFVRQWVGWEDSGLEWWWQLVGLIPRRWVGWDQNGKTLTLVSPLDSPWACCPGGGATSTHCLHAVLSPHK